MPATRTPKRQRLCRYTYSPTDLMIALICLRFIDQPIMLICLRSINQIMIALIRLLSTIRQRLCQYAYNLLPTNRLCLYACDPNGQLPCQYAYRQTRIRANAPTNMTSLLALYCHRTTLSLVPYYCLHRQ